MRERENHNFLCAAAGATRGRRVIRDCARALRLTIRLCTLLIATSAAAAAPVAAPLALNVEAQSVTVSNVSGGGTIVLFSCSRTPRPRTIGVRPDATVLHDEDRDGVVRLEPKDGVPLRSVWIAVDEGSGEFATAAPRSFPLIVRAVGADDFRKDVEGEIASMAVDIPRLIVLIVRPGVGAWLLKSFDGEKGDRDGAPNGRVQLAFEDAQTLDGKETAPKHLKTDDVVVAIDPGHLDVFVARISK